MSSQLQIVTRSKWGALEPKTEPIPLEHPIEYIWLRESPITPPCLTMEDCIRTVQHIQKRDMNYFSDIQANFLIGDDGRVYEGRGWFVQPEKNERWNKYEGEYIEISYIGPFDGVEEKTADLMRSRLYHLLIRGHNKRYFRHTSDDFTIHDAPKLLQCKKDDFAKYPNI